VIAPPAIVGNACCRARDVIVAGPLARLSREETGVMTARHPQSLTVGGIEVGLSNTDKVLYPGDEITKGDLIEYYGEMAGRMLPYLRDRPIAIARYPDGIAGHRIFQKNVPDNFPDWVTRGEVEKQDGVLRQVICDKPATLV
jgi:bifunctional non-homologous end joining protein LigD